MVLTRRNAFILAGLLCACALGLYLGRGLRARAWQPLAQANPDAQVSLIDGMLRLRKGPSTRTKILGTLTFGAPLMVIGRTADNAWLQVRTAEGLVGWVSAEYVQTFIDLNGISIADENNMPNGGYRLSENVAAHLRDIYALGQQLGNRPDVFSKVGDSISVNKDYLQPIGFGLYNLGDHVELQGVINFYLKAEARDGKNSFANESLAAGVGWTATALLDPKNARKGDCQENESPLHCEYRVVRPSVALIMIGTNDAGFLPVQTYKYNLQRIVEQSLEMGIIPVLSTIPARLGKEDRVIAYNQAIVEVARTYEIPLWDYGAAMQNLPNGGLDNDNTHPSPPPHGFEGAADFRPENMAYGYVVRNLGALQVLDAIWREVIA
jgi:hypothetical protein